MLTDGHEHLSSHVSTLLRSRCLIFNVDTRSTFLDEQLCELHDGCEASVSSIRISDNRA